MPGPQFNVNFVLAAFQARRAAKEHRKAQRKLEKKLSRPIPGLMPYRSEGASVAEGDGGD